MRLEKFWQGFFETAANVSLSPQSTMDPETTVEETSSQTLTSDGQEDTSATSYDDQRGKGAGIDYSLSSVGAGEDDSMDDSVDQEAFLASLNKKTRNLSVASDPRDESQRAPVESPFERLRKELEGDFEKGDRRPKHPYPHGENLAPDQKELTEGIAELGPHKSSTTPKPPSHKAVTRILDSAGKRRSGGPGSVARVQATPRGKANPFASIDQNGEAKTAGRPTPSSSSPSKWNGIADLRKTPLAKVKDKKKQRDEGKARKQEWEASDDEESGFGLPAGMSPPVTMQFSVPRSRYAKTPAKQAAQLMVDDLLKSVQANSPAARARAQKLRNSQREQDGASRPGEPSTSSKPSLINTPLKKVVSSSRKRRDSLPTPPTITKRMDATKTFGTTTTPAAAPSALHSGSIPASTSASSVKSSGQKSTAAKLIDRDEGGDGGSEDDDEEVPEDLGTGLSKVAMAKTSAGVDKLLQVDDDEESDEESDDDDEEEEEDSEEDRGARGAAHRMRTTVASPLTTSSMASSSRNIDQDTLFGIREVDQRPSPAASGSNFRPMGQVDETVYNGRPLLSEGRDDTYSAPSPTPFGRR